MLPPGVTLEIAFDGSVFVTHSINDARLTLLIAAILVVLIIFVFLRNLRATIIPGLAIPASIISTFAIMYFLGFSINNFTLLALTIAIGIVVDDAIIVLENAYRHQEELHETPEQAAVKGTNEIGFAVIATTVALVAVFTPLGFLRGSTGRLLSEFGIAVAGAVVISGFVALTLTPMLCAKVLRVPHEHGAIFQVLERGFNAIAERYAKLLQTALRHRGIVVAGTVVTVAMAFVFYKGLQQELIPDDDRGFFLVVAFAPEGSSLEYTDGYVRQVEQIIGKTPGVQGYFTIIGGFAGGVNRAFVGVILKDWSERKNSVQQLVGMLFPSFSGSRHPGVPVQPGRARVQASGAVRGAASRHRAAGAGHGHARAAGPRDQGSHQRGHRLAFQTSRSCASPSTATARRTSGFPCATSRPPSRRSSAAAGSAPSPVTTSCTT